MRGKLPELYTVLHLAQTLSLSFQKKVKFSYQYSGFQKSSHTTFIMYVCNCRSLCGKKTSRGKLTHSPTVNEILLIFKEQNLVVMRNKTKYDKEDWGNNTTRRRKKSSFLPMFLYIISNIRFSSMNRPARLGEWKMKIVGYLC